MTEPCTASIQPQANESGSTSLERRRTTTAYGTWPIDGSYSYYTITADAIYMGANEHSPGNPTWLGGQIWAVNITDGTSALEDR